MIKTRRFDGTEQLTIALARLLRDAAPPGSSPLIMLAGGRTPVEAYRRLSEILMPPTARPVFVLSDERYVPVADRESNFGSLLPLFLAWGLPADRFVRVPTERPIGDAAREWSDRLDALLELHGGVDLGLLGVGADGHTASLFSLDDIRAADAAGRWAVPVKRPSPPDRISVTPAFLQRIRRLKLIVTGSEKKEIASRLLSEPDRLPAGAAVAGHSDVELWLDSAADPG